MAAGPREALNNPTLLFPLAAGNLLLYEFYHDIVIDVLEVVVALLNSSGMRALGCDMISEKFSCVDSFPIISIFECIGDLCAAGTRCAEQENTSNLLSFEFLNQKLVRVLGSLNNQLL